LETFLWIIIILFVVLPLLGRYVAPLIIKYYFKKLQKNFSSQQQSYYKQNKPEGEVTVDHIPETKKSRSDNNTGDYIDYEEIK